MAWWLAASATPCTAAIPTEPAPSTPAAAATGLPRAEREREPPAREPEPRDRALSPRVATDAAPVPTRVPRVPPNGWPPRLCAAVSALVEAAAVRTRLAVHAMEGDTCVLADSNDK
jgi:hypothetical protein